MSRSQVLAGLVGNATDSELSRRVRNLAQDFPSSVPVQQRLAARNVLTAVLARTARSTGIDRRPEVGLAFLEWAATDITGANWDTTLRRLIDRCAECLELLTVDRAAPSPGVSRALAIIAERYGDARLALKDVAREAGLSPWYLARVLKQQTGGGFHANVERTRIAAAKRLLEETILSVKEIATAVGYGGSTQLDRVFKRLYGLTPVAFRSAAHRRLTNRKN